MRILPLISLAFAAALVAAQPADEKLHWHSEWRAAQRAARQQNKPIFAVLVCRH